MSEFRSRAKLMVLLLFRILYWFYIYLRLNDAQFRRMVLHFIEGVRVEGEIGDSIVICLFFALEKISQFRPLNTNPSFSCVLFWIQNGLGSVAKIVHWYRYIVLSSMKNLPNCWSFVMQRHKVGRLKRCSHFIHLWIIHGQKMERMVKRKADRNGKRWSLKVSFSCKSWWRTKKHCANIWIVEFIRWSYIVR